MPAHWTKSALSDIDWLVQNFDDIIPEELSNNLKGFYKVRIGDYWVIYTLKHEEVIVIYAVGHKRKVYNI